MKPAQTGQKYDRIAAWWQQHLQGSRYGCAQLQRAFQFCRDGGLALDVGCGSGGRMVSLMLEQGFQVTGIDVSEQMIRLARLTHPDATFLLADICTFQTGDRFDLIVAWDSIFHLPLSEQEPVVSRLCQLLNPGGVLLYSFGDAVGEHEDVWRGDTFYYSSIGITGNLTVLAANQVCCRHLELDQWPEKHVFVIATREA